MIFFSYQTFPHYSMIYVLTAVKVKPFFKEKGPDSRVTRSLLSNLHFGKMIILVKNVLGQEVEECYSK